MLAQALNDPETKRLLQASVAGTVLPFVGGNGCSAGTISASSSNAQTVTFKSRLGEDHFCAHDSLLTITTTAVQAKPLGDLLTVFTPPFSLKAAP